MRRAIVAGVVVIALAVTGGLALASPSHRPAGPADRASRAGTVLTPSALPQRLAPLRRSLDAYLAQAVTRPRPLLPPRPHSLTVPHVLVPGPTACEVGMGRCSLTPCVQFTAQAAASLVLTPGVVTVPGPTAPRCLPGAPRSVSVGISALPVVTPR